MEKPPVIDLVEALRRTMGDADFLRTMLDDFQLAIPDFLVRLENAYRKRDMTSISKEAHQLKGAAANLGAKIVAAAALKLEQIGKSEHPAGCDLALEELKQAAELFRQEMTHIDWTGLASKSPGQS